MRQKQGVFSLFLLSPSSRRAWIEISSGKSSTMDCSRSPSSRRAWIEIPFLRQVLYHGLQVALLAEGVDRNSHREIRQLPAARRPPRGGRG